MYYSYGVPYLLFIRHATTMQASVDYRHAAAAEPAAAMLQKNRYLNEKYRISINYYKTTSTIWKLCTGHLSKNKTLL